MDLNLPTWSNPTKNRGTSGCICWRNDNKRLASGGLLSSAKARYAPWPTSAGHHAGQIGVAISHRLAV